MSQVSLESCDGVVEIDDSEFCDICSGLSPYPLWNGELLWWAINRFLVFRLVPVHRV